MQPDPAALCLVVLQKWHENSWRRDRRIVERVYETHLAISVAVPGRFASLIVRFPLDRARRPEDNLHGLAAGDG
jgi:hypothetical protein